MSFCSIHDCSGIPQQRVRHAQSQIHGPLHRRAFAILVHQMTQVIRAASARLENGIIEPTCINARATRHTGTRSPAKPLATHW